MEVGQDQDFLSSAEEFDEPPLLSDGNVDGRSDQSDMEDEDVVFNNQNSLNCGDHSVQKVQGHAIDDDDFNEDEMKTMMKFAKFLEKQGFLKQANGLRAGTSDQKEASEPQKKGTKRKTPGKSGIAPSYYVEDDVHNLDQGRNVSPNQNTSETTIYRRAMVMHDENPSQVVGDPMVMNIEVSPVIEQGANRISTSSEDDVANSSDENLVVMEAVEGAGMIPCEENVNDTDRILFKQFLDYHHKEW